MNLFQIIPSYIHSAVVHRKGDVHYALPEKIGDLKLVKNLNIRKSYPYCVGLYKNKSGKLVVAKIWQGGSHSIHYSVLKHEIDVVKTLTQVYIKNKKRIATHLRKISIPEYKGMVENDKQLVLLTEYVVGTPLRLVKDVDHQFEVYKNSIEFLRAIGKFVSYNQKKKITVKSMAHFQKIYPIILVVALIKHPKLVKNLISGVPVFIKQLIQGNKDPKVVLVHGDLHLENILLSEKKVWILDMEQTMFSYPIYEKVTALSSLRNTAKLRELLLYDVLFQCSRRYSLRRLFKSLLVNCSTHNLTSNLPDKNIRLYTKLLQLGVQL